MPVAAIYGANASGKTNVIRAMEFMGEAVCYSQSRWQPDKAIPRSPFLGNEESPSRFVVDFVLEKARYQYGFSADSNSFLEEWLFAFPSGGRKQMWFQRSAGSPIAFGAKMRGDNRVIESLTRKNSLFLSAAAQNNHPALSPLYQWFSQSLSFVSTERLALIQEACGRM